MSYEQGIEKATKAMFERLGTSMAKDVYLDATEAAVEAFLSAQSTIQWCEAHNAESIQNHGGESDECWRAVWVDPDSPQAAAGLCRIVERDAMTKLTTDTLLVWLQEAENDIGDLARIVEGLAANMGFEQSAYRANGIAHKWEFRRNERALRT